MLKSIVEAGLKLATSKKDNINRGTIYVDRTIYYTREIEDSEGKILLDKDGDPMVINTAYILAGSKVSQEVYDIAMAKEKEFKELNDLFRSQMDANKVSWRILERDQKALTIQGGYQI